MKRLIVIAGATASGKTSISVQLAQILKTEIISCDSRQFYKELSIGTAKPSKDEMKGIPHHFIDSHSISEEINAGKYEQLVLPVLDELFKSHDQLIITGGSGLFIDAIVNGFDYMPDVPTEIRENLNKKFETDDVGGLFEQLQKLDPEYSKIVDSENPKRIIRALEVCLSSNKTYSEFRTGQKAKRNFEVIKIVLDRPREELYERINHRVDLMMNEGLLDEVKSLLPFKHLNALQTVGYREIFSYLDNEFDLNRAIELIKQNSRRYAKRQLTWFRRSSDYHWIHADDFGALRQLLAIND